MGFIVIILYIIIVTLNTNNVIYDSNYITFISNLMLHSLFLCLFIRFIFCLNSLYITLNSNNITYNNIYITFVGNMSLFLCHSFLFKFLRQSHYIVTTSCLMIILYIIFFKNFSSISIMSHMIVTSQFSNIIYLFTLNYDMVT